MAGSGTPSGTGRPTWVKAGAGFLLSIVWIVLVWAVYTVVGAGTRWLAVAVLVGAFPFVALVRWLVWRQQTAALEGTDGET